VTANEILDGARHEQRDFRNLNGSTKLEEIKAVMQGCGYGREMETLISALELTNKFFRYEKQLV
jgi:hypothetical protein